MQPGYNDILYLTSLIGKVLLSSTSGQYPLIIHTEVLVVCCYRGQVNGLTGGIGLSLCLCLRTGEHQGAQLFRFRGEEFRQDVLLRVDEFRLHLRTVADGLVAYQMVEILIGIITLGNLYEGAILGADTLCITAIQSAQHVLIDAVGDSTDGAHRSNHVVLYRTDIQVGISSYHVLVATGDDVLTDIDGVRESTMTFHVIRNRL